MAPSRILSERKTSNVKSACPGVSIRLIVCETRDFWTDSTESSDEPC